MYWTRYENLQIGAVIGDAHGGVDKIEIPYCTIEVLSHVKIGMRAGAGSAIEALLDRVSGEHFEGLLPRYTNKLVVVLGMDHSNMWTVGWGYDDTGLHFATLRITPNGSSEANEYNVNERRQS